MSDLFHNLGIDWRFLIAQLVNFTILFFVLKKFLYRPIIGVLEKRRREIEETDKKTREIREIFQRAENERNEILKEARKEAMSIIAKAEIAAKEKAEKIIEAGRQEAAIIVSEGRKKLDEEKMRIISEAKMEIGSLVALAVEKAINEGARRELHDTLTAEALRIMRTTENTNK
jgi:F-type H+-transporting ATPase subunit b